MTFEFLPPVIAHRGSSALAPENTMSAFLTAAQSGAQWIEFDVTQSSDGVPIVFHDETLERLTPIEGEVIAQSFSRLRQLDCGSWFDPFFAGERIMSLQEAFAFLDATNMRANVEIKTVEGFDEVLVHNVAKKFGPWIQKRLNSLLFSSFSLDALSALHQIIPGAAKGLLLHEWRDDWQRICDELACVSVHLFDEITTPTRVAAIKKTGRQVLVYTVNDAKRAQVLFSYGVDAIFADDAKSMIASLDRQSRLASER